MPLLLQNGKNTLCGYILINWTIKQVFADMTAIASWHIHRQGQIKKFSKGVGQKKSKNIVCQILQKNLWCSRGSIESSRFSTLLEFQLCVKCSKWNIWDLRLDTFFIDCSGRYYTHFNKDDKCKMMKYPALVGLIYHYMYKTLQNTLGWVLTIYREFIHILPKWQITYLV